MLFDDLSLINFMYMHCELAASKVKPFPDIKLGINIPVRGETSDLLNADGNKNDYEWLVSTVFNQQINFSIAKSNNVLILKPFVHKFL